MFPSEPTGGDQLACAQEADGEPHDGGLVQVGGEAVGERQLAGQLVEHLRLLAPPAARRVPGLLLAPLRAAPAGRKREQVSLATLSSCCGQEFRAVERGRRTERREQHIETTPTKKPPPKCFHFCIACTRE